MGSEPTRSEPILDLSTLIERPRIRIDGNLYEIRSPDELSLIESHFFALKGQEIDRLTKAGNQGEELAELIRDVVRKVVVELPSKVLSRLSEAHMLAIVEVFTGLLLRRRLGLAGAIAKAGQKTRNEAAPESAQDGAGQSTGAKNFPASSASTAETPSGGSPMRRQRS
ncbi:hypothetical protein H2509_13550 [Stappia sp. F7233]|uniref:Uncharacterized protein n=1 Tax=Stappia albiluteola TaxID=2758565 RepID=A0A839AEC0_9HYPH|nr:hypothetical protein [Stappia albiluteola]MBA5778072.1 hypothetical protein [Stappia albiluteola]MBA5778150.1 hypothetical protein [Stappia albiluteola]